MSASKKDNLHLEEIITSIMSALHKAQKNSIAETLKIIQEIHSSKDEDHMKIKHGDNDKSISLLPLIATNFINIDEANIEFAIDIHEMKKQEDNPHKISGKISESGSLNMKLTIRRHALNLYQDQEKL